MAIRPGVKSADTGYEGRGCFQLTVVRILSFAIRVVMPAMMLLLFTPAEARAKTGTSLSDGEAIKDPISAGLDKVLRTPTAAWRSPLLEVFGWDLFPDILVIDTVDFHFQDRMFTRLAYFVEKKGFRGRLMTNAQLAGRHGWNAHDYGPDGLAFFYNAASEKAFPLNPEEKALEALALREGILVPDGDHVAPGRGGVLSISRSSSEIERRYLLTHESFHGIFFSSPEYREFCFRLWDSIPPAERRFYRSFLDSLGYDGDDRFLAVNEFQAYLMQQPLEYAASYFERFLARFGEPGTGGAVEAARLVATAKELDGFLRFNFGLPAGETVRPIGKGAQGQ
jgi:hypothetical protein